MSWSGSAFEHGRLVTDTRAGSQHSYDAVEISRREPRIVISARVRHSPMLDAFVWRVPARFTAPAIRFSEPQRLFVTGDKFTILTEREGLVPDSTYLFGEYLWGDFFTAPRQILLAHDHVTIVAGNAAWRNYSHWLFQCVSPLLLARAAGLNDVHALVPPMNAAQRHLLALAEIDQAKLVELPAGEAAVLERGVYSNLTGGDYPFRPHPAIVRAFELLGATVPRSAYAGRKVFVSRADTRNRPMLNERELRDILEADGFVTLVPGALSMAEQIALFRDAALIVGQHGAALTNLLFAPPGSDGPEVVELQQDNYPALAFAKICQVKQLRYTAVVGQMVDPGADGRHDSTWEADVPLIRAVLAGDR